MRTIIGIYKKYYYTYKKQSYETKKNMSSNCIKFD